MKITFLNPTAASVIQNTLPTTLELDGLGRFQYLDRAFSELETIQKDSESRSILASLRQKIESKELKEALFFNAAEAFVLGTPTYISGQTDNVAIIIDNANTARWEKVSIFKVTEDLSVLPEEIYNQGKGDTFIINAGKAPYTLFHFKCPNGLGVIGASFEINPSDILLLQVKEINNEWQTISPIINYANGQPNHGFEMAVYDSSVGIEEVKLIVRNTNIGEEYCTYLVASSYYPNDKPISQDIRWDKDIPVKNITLSPFDSLIPIMFLGSVIVGDKTYENIEIPDWVNPVSSLILEYHTGNETIMKTRYPVMLEDIQIGKTIKDLHSNSSGYVSSGGIETKVSVDKITWVNLSELNTLAYPSEYSRLPKHLYFKLAGFFEEAYIKYTLNRSINCAWPVTSDEVLSYSGNGIKISNPENKAVKLIGKVISGKTYSSFSKLLPLGVLGID